MIKVFYNYGTMKSSKTANLLMVYHNYQDKGINPILIKPALDTRSKYVESRVGIKEKADYVVHNNGHFEETAGHIFETARYNNQPILLDEAQFFDPKFVKKLGYLAHSYDGKDANNVSIMAYGLLTNFMGRQFKGSSAWIEEADDIREIKTVCELCNHKATRNALFKEGVMVTNSDTDVVIGDLQYKVLCPYHFYKIKKSIDK